MGRLIEVDVEKLKELLNDIKIELTNNIISIVRENYIPKADFEARLKADMVAMLEELQSEIRQYHEIGCDEDCNNCHMVGCIEPVNVIKDLDIIQQKIDKLKS